MMAARGQNMQVSIVKKHLHLAIYSQLCLTEFTSPIEQIRSIKVFLSIAYSKLMHFYGMTEHSGIKDTDIFTFDMIFRQHLLCDCNIALLTCVCILYYITCTTGCPVVHKTDRTLASLCAALWSSVVFVIAPVSFLHSCLSLEAET